MQRSTEGAPARAEGASRNLSGKRTDGAKPTSRPRPFCSPGRRVAQANPLHADSSRRRRKDGRFRRLGHAGALRLADRGASRGAPRRRACSTSRTCSRSTSSRAAGRERSGVATSCAAHSPTMSTSLTVPGKALYSCLLTSRRRRARRPDRLFPARRLVPPGRQRRAPPTRTSPGSAR